MGTEEGLRFVSTIVGGGFVGYAIVAMFRGTLYDSDEGTIDQTERPVAFWLSVFGMTVLGLFILGGLAVAARARRLRVDGTPISMTPGLLFMN